MFGKITHEKFHTLLRSGVLHKDNHERCVRIFYDAAKIIHYRQERLRKSQLKVGQITSALVLVDFYHSSIHRFVSTGALHSNFAGCPENTAVSYFSASILGTVKDSYDRPIEIDDHGLLSLYKEQNTGKHVMAAENYEPLRGKRLPWIRQVLSNTRSIYQADEIIKGKFRRRYLYFAIASIPLASGPVDNYFVVVVAEDGNANLKFITAYPIDSHNKFLSRIEECTPFLGK